MSQATTPTVLPSALGTLLRSVDQSPTAGVYLDVARKLRQYADQLRPIRVALLGTFTVKPLVPFLEVEAARQGFAADVYVGPFNAVSQELLSAESGCAQHQPHVVFVASLLEDISPSLATDFLALPASEIASETSRTVTNLTQVLTSFREHASSAIVVHNFSLPRHSALGIAEVLEPDSQTAAIRALNAGLVDAVKPIAGVYVLDGDRLAAEVGYQNWHDPKLWYLGRAPFSVRALRAVARSQATFIRALTAAPRKCLVLDLDNTLWGGVVGERGVAGIELGQSYPGNVFRDFQRTVLQLQRRGILLAINSKNNQSDAEEVFRTHPDMILTWEHFASVRINWRPKPDNMREIASELSIGLDSLVFVDDDQAECELMRQALPEVLTLDVQPDALTRMDALRNTGVFDKLGVTEEDRRRAELYRNQNERQVLRQSSLSVEDFLRTLDMVVSIRTVDDFSFPRMVDLIQKTNQFNLTTRRHTAAELAKTLSTDSRTGFCLSVTDRFGDSGIVGVALVDRDGPRAHIDSLLLSCRVIGRSVETAFLSFLADWAHRRGALTLEGEFIPTAKNAPAADFYARHGFSVVDDGDGTTTSWTLDLPNARFQWPDYIRRAETNPS